MSHVITPYITWPSYMCTCCTYNEMFIYFWGREGGRGKKEREGAMDKWMEGGRGEVWREKRREEGRGEQRKRKKEGEGERRERLRKDLYNVMEVLICCSLSLSY